MNKSDDATVPTMEGELEQTVRAIRVFMGEQFKQGVSREVVQKELESMGMQTDVAHYLIDQYLGV